MLELDYHREAIMKIVLALALCCTIVHAQKKSPTQLPAVDENHFVILQQKYLDELQCLKTFDRILTSEWTRNLEILIEDLDSDELDDTLREPSKPVYNTYEQEWLMESGSAAREIDSCIRGLVPEVVSSMSQEEIDCLNSIFAFHIEEELVYEEFAEESLRRQAREQLPFRKFVSFNDFVDLMFQNRTPDALGSFDRSVYEQAEGWLTTDQDRVSPTYAIEQGCEWKNAIALHQASNVNARFNEFVRQVRDAVNRQLANTVIKSWDVNSTLPRDKYVDWLQARHKMMPKIWEEVKKLRGQKKDAQWLCEHATEFARVLSEEQAAILVSDSRGYKYWINYWPTGFEVSNVAVRARGAEKALEKVHDSRHHALKTLADKYEKGSMCLSAFLHLVQNHRRFDIALAFVDGQYNYPELRCKDESSNFELIAPRFCKCVGSFCVHHGLDKLFAKDYALMQGPNGTYKVVPSGVKSEDEVQS